MRQTNIANLYQIQKRFLRSANLERDFTDPTALQGYILTPETEKYLEVLTKGLRPESGHRSWRITGDYGSGKSSFGLVLAHVLSGKKAQLPQKLRQAVNFRKLGIKEPKLFPVLITGAREPISLVILRSLRDQLVNAFEQEPTPDDIAKLDAAISLGLNNYVPDETVVSLILDVNDLVIKSGKGTGLLIILDELGKFLEYAAFNPDRQDIYLFQKLSEVAQRSRNKPIFVVGLLHQGFNAYTTQLNPEIQREWEKVAGRFEYLLFDQPFEHTVGLIADALNLRVQNLPKNLVDQAKQQMERTIKLGWYGPNINKDYLIDSAARLYPLHSTLLPILIQVFRRFGQNQRSLFSFLLSTEPFALQEFSERLIREGEFYRLHHFYDYVRTSFGSNLNQHSYRNHWNLIDSIVSSFPVENVSDLEILKTVGLLNLLDDNSLLASEEVLTLSIEGVEKNKKKEIERSIDKLQSGKRVLYNRGFAGGYRLWAYTSVNLEKAYEDAGRALEQPQRVSSLIKDFVEARPLVARRHYIETGNLRHFSVRYLSVSDLESNIGLDDKTSDGQIIITLCETDEERIRALKFIEKELLDQYPNILISVPRPLNNLAPVMQEARKWQWVQNNTPELLNDKYALEEVSRQINITKLNLEKGIQNYIGLDYSSSETGLQWFRAGRPLEIKSGRDLLSKLSDICYEVFRKAPQIHNELVNRRVLSSAAAGARLRLLERMFKTPSEPFLGMDISKKPPEMSMYLSVLKKAGLHRKTDEGYAILEPDALGDECNVRPALHKIKEILQESPEGRLKVSDVFAALREPPFGIRDGLLPLLLAVFVIAENQDIALYEDEAFLHNITGFDFLRLIKAPETFEIQFCEIVGVKNDLFEQLRSILNHNNSNKAKVDLLDVVRPLLTFIARQPLYTRETRQLSEIANNVRQVLLNATDPAKLIFRDLPTACECKPFTTNENSNQNVKAFVNKLKGAMDEIDVEYKKLLERLKKAIAKRFNLLTSLDSLRNKLTERTSSISQIINEPKLNAFCLRLSDNALSEEKWLESFGSLLCSKTPLKWNDEDEQFFQQELNQLYNKFKRVEAMNFENKKPSGNETALRVAITQLNGTELNEVIYINKEEEPKIQELEAKIEFILKQSEEELGLAATARVFLKAMSKQ